MKFSEEFVFRVYIIEIITCRRTERREFLCAPVVVLPDVRSDRVTEVGVDEK